MPGWDFASVQDDVNPHILHMLEGTFWLNAAHIITITLQYLSRNVRKRTFWHVRSAKIQISLSVRAVGSEYSWAAFWIAKAAQFLYADSEDSNQTARMRRLIWVFIVRTGQQYVFGRVGSFVLYLP